MTADIFTPDATDLEVVVSQAANDLKVTGFGQRTRAALRRNFEAGEATLLPTSQNRGISGPDLIRHLNGLLYHFSAGIPASSIRRSDRELLQALRDSLLVVADIVASVWPKNLRAVASTFVDYDDLPAPFCVMYPNTRGFQSDPSVSLPRPTIKIIDRVRTAMEKTPVWDSASACARHIHSTQLQTLSETREAFLQQVTYQQDETFSEWQTRAYISLEERRREVPLPLLQLNRLIHTSVAALVSLAVWDFKLSPDGIIRWEPIDYQLRGAERRRSEVQLDEPQPHGPDIPSGLCLQVVPTIDLMVMPLDAAIQLRRDGTFAGIAILKGVTLSGQNGLGMKVELNVVRMSAFESDDDNIGRL